MARRRARKSRASSRPVGRGSPMRIAGTAFAVIIIIVLVVSLVIPIAVGSRGGGGSSGGGAISHGG